MRLIFRLTLGLLATLTATAGLWLETHRRAHAPPLLAYVSTRGTHDLYLTWPGRPQPQPLVTGPAWTANPTWAGVCTRGLSGCRLAYTVAAAPQTTAPRRLAITTPGGPTFIAQTPPDDDVIASAWSPDGSMLAVVTRDRNGQTDIFLVDARDGSAHNLTDHPAYDFNPAWSPDSTRLAFVSYRGMEPNNQGKIFVATLDAAWQAAKLVQITPATTEDRLYSWSPDGAWLLYTAAVRFAEPLSEEDLFIARPDGSETRQLTTDPARDTDPTWSPDGQWIAFETEAHGDPAIAVVRPDGSGLHTISTYPTPDLNPVWSPDGQWIAFQKDRAPKRDIFLARPDGSETINLTADAGVDLRPVWSPDGQWIAFETMRDGNREIYIIRPDGTDAHNLSQWRGVDAAPVWSPVARGTWRRGLLWGLVAGLAVLLGADVSLARISRARRRRPPAGDS